MILCAGASRHKYDDLSFFALFCAWYLFASPCPSYTAVIWTIHPSTSPSTLSLLATRTTTNQDLGRGPPQRFTLKQVDPHQPTLTRTRTHSPSDIAFAEADPIRPYILSRFDWSVASGPRRYCLQHTTPDGSSKVSLAIERSHEG